MYVEILILAHLARQPAHGYEIKRSVEQTLGEAYPINNNQLYPTLRRFEEMGAITREVVRQMGKPDRHIYRLTDRGDEVLQGLLRDFPPELARDDAEFQVRVAFFHLLEADARLAILEARAAELRAYLQHLRRSQEAVHAHPEMPWALEVVSYTQQRIEQELEWIAGLRHRAM
jgi:DNA-binding PadR family transcriptional regulator